MNTIEIFGKNYTLPPDAPRIIALLHDQIDALRAENADLRQTLIDATGQRDEYYRQLIARTNALQQELDKALQERSQ